jgi:hypothetical protein
LGVARFENQCRTGCALESFLVEFRKICTEQTPTDEFSNHHSSSQNLGFSIPFLAP